MRLSKANSRFRRLTAPFHSLCTSTFGPRRTNVLGPGRGCTGKKLGKGGIPASAFVWLTLIPLALVFLLAEESAAQGNLNCPADMFGYLPLGDSQGGPFSDYLGVHDGTCGGLACPTATGSGKVGGAQSFIRATGTGIDIPAHTDFDFGGNTSFSIEYWMKTSGAGCPGTQVVVGRDEPGSGTPLHWWTGCWDGGNPAFVARSTGNQLGVARATSSNVADGYWHHIVAVHDHTAGGTALVSLFGREQTSARDGIC